MAKILVTPRSLTRGGEPALEVLKEAGHQLIFCAPGKVPEEQELKRLVPGCAAWLAGIEKITDAVLAHADCLKVISRNGTGVDSIDLDACRRRGITVLRAEGANARGVAELTLALILSLLRSIPFSDARIKAGGWERRQGMELEGKTLGVIGAGRVGRLVTSMALVMGMRVLAHDAYPDPRYAPSPDFRAVSLDELLSSSDVVTLHCPPLPGGRALIDAAALARMKKGVILVNTARGGLVDDNAAAAALEDGRLAGYAVDAYEKEPPGPNALLAHDRVIATPHIGAFTAESVSRATRAAVDNLLGALGGAADPAPFPTRAVSSLGLHTARRSTMYFIGVTTRASMIMRVFPRWAEALELGECALTGIDLALHDQPERYREVVRFIKEDPLSIGALVTTHKIDLLRAARDIFDSLDPLASLMGEVSSISKTGAGLLGAAKDPISVGRALEAFLPERHWERTGADAFIIGAGGSGIALSWYLSHPDRGDNHPKRIFVSNRSPGRLEEMRRIHASRRTLAPIEYVLAPRPQDNDRILERLSGGSLVVNATGLGKDAPGSPLSDAGTFPERGIAWDFNYRGELDFLRQARGQERARELHVEDGWMYFLAGWLAVIGEVFAKDIPLRGPSFDGLRRIAEIERR